MSVADRFLRLLENITLTDTQITNGKTSRESVLTSPHEVVRRKSVEHGCERLC